MGDFFNAGDKLNDDFLPKIGDPVDFGLTILGADGTGPGSSTDPTETIISWLEEQIFTPPGDVPGPDSWDRQSENTESEGRQDEEGVGEAGGVLTNNAEHATDEKLSKTWASENTSSLLPLPSNIAAHKAADRGNEEVLEELISGGADINVSTGLFGNALAAACARGHDNIVQLLLDKGVNVNAPGVSHILHQWQRVATRALSSCY
ncbi:hypothetical protein F5B21DRAFT_498779 [Xylaria acuta]|nr:hypothetical protein F5B21DRAFT_498779 [Xylaria acuta]